MVPTCREASTPGRQPRWPLRSATGAPAAARAGLTLVTLLLGASGCGGDEGAETPPAGNCDPLTQAGCAIAEKCSILVESEDPYLATVTCVPGGNIPVGGLCGFVEPGPWGFDDCLPGNFCLDGLCTPICALGGAGCTGAEACVAHGGVFEGRDLGLCTRLCDPLDVASCAPEQGCYLGLATGQATCHGAGSLGQGDACVYIDACAPGLGCALLAADGQHTLCTAFCDPASAATASGQTCVQVLGTSEARCIVINRFYSDTPEVPDDVGMCVDCGDPGYAELTVCSSVASSAR
jgi:hypothetical protein